MCKNSLKFLLIIIALFFVLVGCGDDNEQHVHTEVIDEGIEATCTTTGLTIGMHCSVCEEILVEQKVIPLLEHTYASATCEKPATCTVCGTTNGTTLEHDFNEWYEVSEGVLARECKDCAYQEINEIDPVHTHTIEVISGKDATCTEAGLTEGKKCSECGEILVEQEVISTLAHDFNEWYKESDNLERRDCKNCSHYETKEIKVEHTHSYSKWLKIIDATCDSEGEERRYCDSCSEYETRKIAVIGHDYGNWYVDTPATLTKEGIERRDCKNCTHYETKSIPTSEAPDASATIALLQADLDAISLPSTLITNYSYTNNGTNGTKFTYLSSNAGVLDDEGNVTRMLYDVTVTVRVIGVLNGIEKEKQVSINIPKYELPEKAHQIIIEGSELAISPDSTNFTLNNGAVELKPGVTSARFYLSESEAINTPYPFTSLVASWGATDTSANAYVRVRIALKVNGKWSNWVSYGDWGFEKGNGNASGTDSTGLIKISIDEVMCVTGTATAIQYEVTLTRTSATTPSPKFKYISLAPEYTNYSYSVNRKHLPESVFHNVPKRYQLDVTSTTNGASGNVMCSATSTTMMLEYYGIDLSSKTKQFGYIYPQEYIARNVVRDKNMSGGGFGNWVYNTVSMSHYGFKSYVARYYSIEELMYELTKGPVCLSIAKCTMTQLENYKTYTHSGHIIVAVGYKYVNGQLYITCNDPYVSQVTCNYSATLITNYWKDIAYVIEK